MPGLWEHGVVDVDDLLRIAEAAAQAVVVLCVRIGRPEPIVAVEYGLSPVLAKVRIEQEIPVRV